MKADSKYGLKNASKWLRNFRYNKQCEEDSVEQPTSNIHEKTFSSERYPQIPPTAPKLSDLITKHHLEKTSKIYEADLSMLEENHHNYLQGIECLVDEINNFSELKVKTEALELENIRQKGQLRQLIKQHSKARLEKQMERIKIEERFEKMKGKVKMLMQICQPDISYGVQMDMWNQYMHEINHGFDKNIELNEEQIMKQIVPLPKEEKKVPEPSLRKTLNKDNLNLLGDLKMFAKNFKMP